MSGMNYPILDGILGLEFDYSWSYWGAFVFPSYQSCFVPAPTSLFLLSRISLSPSVPPALKSFAIPSSCLPLRPSVLLLHTHAPTPFRSPAPEPYFFSFPSSHTVALLCLPSVLLHHSRTSSPFRPPALLCPIPIPYFPLVRTPGFQSYLVFCTKTNLPPSPCPVLCSQLYSSVVDFLHVHKWPILKPVMKWTLRTATVASV
ncbi:hypothetical protein GYMLUDRAFT_252199 [Collybiopsis luxurians FD-317 M1]|uniref:Uncharacterized protein n=1 Tax=Collybiopsis luxurians FD-317 M1 TaxID=944289 RepID=A0A0D0BNZ3_9AGAR|nr:hypothetical protein GYMLUDRAFT_252199 [Collybiopsis luxurians FD-317 M1]